MQVPDPSPTPTPDPIITMVAGDCTGAIDFEKDTIASIRVTGCETWHLYEVASIIPLTQEGYPGAEKIGAQAEADCTKAFTKYVGVAPEYSRFLLAYVAPNESSWEVPDDRVIACLVGSATGDIRGSAKGDTDLFPKLKQCTGPQDGRTPLEIVVFDCAGKHNYEVYAQKAIKTKERPSIEELDKLVTQECADGFKDFVGIPATDSKYDYSWFIASEDVWSKVKDHRLVCMAGSEKGNISGSLKGVKK
jgi:hypothetical protein